MSGPSRTRSGDRSTGRAEERNEQIRVSTLRLRFPPQLRAECPSWCRDLGTLDEVESGEAEVEAEVRGSVEVRNGKPDRLEW